MQAAGPVIRGPCCNTPSHHVTRRQAAPACAHSKSSSSSSGNSNSARFASGGSGSSRAWTAPHSSCSALLHAAAPRSSCRAAAAAQSSSSSAPQQPDLSSIRKAGDLERLLFAQQQQQQPGGGSSQQAEQRPNAPVTPADFVQALEMVVRSSGQAVNPQQLDEIFDDLLATQLLARFSAAQLATTVKDLAVLCQSVRGDLLAALLQQLQRQMAAHALDTQQLSNVAWGLMRLMPVAEPRARQVLGMHQQWLDTYTAAVQQQLQRIVQQDSDRPQQQQQHEEEPQQQDQQHQQQQVPVPRLPSALQVANLLLLPAAAMQPPQPPLLAVLEQVLLLRQHSLCGYAVAQLLTCYVRLGLRPAPDLLAALLAHLQEEWMLYDYDELTQVAFNAYVLQLQLPDTLLADMSQRAQALEQAGQAAASDREVLREALQRLAARKAGAAREAGAARA